MPRELLVRSIKNILDFVKKKNCTTNFKEETSIFNYIMDLITENIFSTSIETFEFAKFSRGKLSFATIF